MTLTWKLPQWGYVGFGGLGCPIGGYRRIKENNMETTTMVLFRV